MPEISSSKYLVQAGWDDVPHLTQKAKDELLSSTLPYLRDARSKGIPSLGAGAIYPIPESDIICDPFQIPPYFPRLYGFDVGWKKTAAVWLAHDRNVDVVYAYAEHYRGQAEPSVHAASIRARGDWIPGAIDPASRARTQIDGRVLLTMYLGQGLRLVEAEHAVEAGLYEVYVRLTTGRLKIFKSLQNTLMEYRLYRRDEKGMRVKQLDHLMDALRYGIMMLQLAVPMPVPLAGVQTHIADMNAGY